MDWPYGLAVWIGRMDWLYARYSVATDELIYSTAVAVEANNSPTRTVRMGIIRGFLVSGEESEGGR